jgi:hypothetical protein
MPAAISPRAPEKGEKLENQHGCGQDPGGVQIEPEEDRDRNQEQTEAEWHVQQVEQGGAHLQRSDSGRGDKQRLERPDHLLGTQRTSEIVEQQQDGHVHTDPDHHELDVGGARTVESGHARRIHELGEE